MGRRPKHLLEDRDMAEEERESQAVPIEYGKTPPGPRSPTEESSQRALMEKVLRQTLESAEADSAEDEAELGVLRGVASRYRGQPFGLEPVAVGLVEAMLHARFPETLFRGSMWQSMSRHIAQQLYEDPLCRGRLERLWAGLGGGPE
jgi:hypothetical protein